MTQIFNSKNFEIVLCLSPSIWESTTPLCMSSICIYFHFCFFSFFLENEEQMIEELKFFQAKQPIFNLKKGVISA